MKKTLGICILFCIPTMLFAAGFPNQAIFLSKDTVTEGQVVLIHVVISNTADTTFIGKLLITEGKTQLGTVSISLGSSDAQTVSVSWHPSAGEHTITADLYGTTGALAQEERATFSVISSAPSAPLPTTPVESSQPVEAVIKKISPVAATKATPTFRSIDAERVSMVNTLDKGVSWTENQLLPQNNRSTAGQILGAETQKNVGTSTNGVLTNVRLIGTTILLYLLLALRYVITHVGFFYPILVILFFYMLWKLTAGVRRH